MRRGALLLIGLMLLVTACQGSGGDALARVKSAGKIVVSTDPNYPPQSLLNEDNQFEGFDIDVATEIAKRLGVKAEFLATDFSAVTAGNWANRWDMSVGSVTITPERSQVLDFTQPYYYTPAQMATRPDTGITTLDGFANKTVCVGADTTYLAWLQGTLKLPESAGPITPPPAGVKATTLETDINCAEAWKAGRNDADGWLSASETVQGAIDQGFPVVAVGDPVFFEPLAVAFDKSVKDNDSLVKAVDDIIGKMHDGGTLKQLSVMWYGGRDLTTQ
jgi:polar amino acid transport system substrate-binding protein